jgi:hypothetical protein
MSQRTGVLWALALCLTLAGQALAQDDGTAAPAPKKKGKTKAAAKASSSDDSETPGVDKARFEAYLKERLTKIDEAQKIRMDFFDQERQGWEDFWSKIRKDRRNFEYRTTRQTLDLFDSLASLDAKDHPATVSNFERLQSEFIKSFEAQQKQKIADFFAERELRWKQFYAEQEKERADFMADAESGWQQNKAAIKDGSALGAAEDAPAPKKKKPAKKASSTTSASDKDDVWH